MVIKSAILHKSVDINFIFCRHCYARGGERVPGAVRKYVYTSLDDTIVASYCNYIQCGTDDDTLLLR